MKAGQRTAVRSAALAAKAAIGGLAAVAAWQRRHPRALACDEHFVALSDEHFVALSAPLERLVHETAQTPAGSRP